VIIDPLAEWALAEEVYYCPLCYKGDPEPLVRFTLRRVFVDHLQQHRLAEWVTNAIESRGIPATRPVERTLNKLKVSGNTSLVRIINALAREGYETIESVDAAEDRLLRTYRYVGDKGIALIRKRIDEYLQR
jgi:hypothetical protein